MDSAVELAVTDGEDGREDGDPDRDALALAAAGDVGAAVQRLMARHGARIYRYCRSALHDPVLADDVHQQVFLQVLRDLPRFRRRASVRNWILAIAHHRMLDAAKRRRRAHAHLEPAQADLAELPDLGPSPAASLDAARLQEALAACLAELDAPIRTALLLRYQQGLTFEEMAEICDEKPGTLQARVTRALPVLRAMLAGRAPRQR